MKLANAVLTILLLAASPARADDLRTLARRLGDAARAAGFKRVAVARLESADGFAEGALGTELSERLTISLVRDGRVEAVERSLLSKLADEVSLDRTGAVAGGAAREVRLAPVDGLVVGRYESDGNGVRVFARVVDARTGVIAGAGQAEVADASLSFDPFAVPVPRLAGGFPDWDARDGLRDAPADAVPEADVPAPLPAPACGGAAARVNVLQEKVLDLKARYWAFRLRLGADAASISVNPGTTIPDPGLRERFYARLRFWHAAPRLPAMTKAELGTLADAEGRSYELVRDCGL
jgi:hypothetical protein